MAFNTRKLKFRRHLVLRPAEFTQIYNLADYEKRLDIPGLDQIIFYFHLICAVMVKEYLYF